MRFLCDEMLSGLARLLRAAGHDVLLAPAQSPDSDLIRRAAEEERLLLTRDGDLAAAVGERGLRLRGDTADGQAEELSGRVAVDWLAAPFTRCLVDNTLLRPAAALEIAALPGDTAARPGPFTACPACGRVYWPGSHVRRMLEKLTALPREGEGLARKSPGSNPTCSP
ncbi:MAG TPA: DUF5615 family PIN-like protein [Caulobacteraceae bacterium]|nr:DUF5615 family PIN-like protein [Caulobacteraceae bacterium]